jgi:hypothetical protein
MREKQLVRCEDLLVIPAQAGMTKLENRVVTLLWQRTDTRRTRLPAYRTPAPENRARLTLFEAAYLATRVD